MSEAGEVHDLDPEQAEREVRTFDHWFGAVQDYLSDLEHGHRVGIVSEELEPDDVDRLTTALCNYAVAETAALEASSGLVRLAPNRASKVFLATQAVDEARHVEVILQRLEDIGVEDPTAEIERRTNPAVREFKRRLLHLVDTKQWDLAIFAQNVSLEAMEFSAFRAHATVGDPVTCDMLERMLRDERRHLGFGENEIARCLRTDPSRRSQIESVKNELEDLAINTFEYTAKELAVESDTITKLGRDYRDAVQRLGL